MRYEWCRDHLTDATISTPIFTGPVSTPGFSSFSTPSLTSTPDFGSLLANSPSETFRDSFQRDLRNFQSNAFHQSLVGADLNASLSSFARRNAATPLLSTANFLGSVPRGFKNQVDAAGTYVAGTVDNLFADPLGTLGRGATNVRNSAVTVGRALHGTTETALQLAFGNFTADGRAQNAQTIVNGFNNLSQATSNFVTTIANNSAQQNGALFGETLANIAPSLFLPITRTARPTGLVDDI